MKKTIKILFIILMATVILASSVVTSFAASTTSGRFLYNMSMTADESYSGVMTSGVRFEGGFLWLKNENSYISSCDNNLYWRDDVGSFFSLPSSYINDSISTWSSHKVTYSITVAPDASIEQYLGLSLIFREKEYSPSSYVFQIDQNGDVKLGNSGFVVCNLYDNAHLGYGVSTYLTFTVDFEKEFIYYYLGNVDFDTPLNETNFVSVPLKVPDHHSDGLAFQAGLYTNNFYFYVNKPGEINLEHLSVINGVPVDYYINRMGALQLEMDELLEYEQLYYQELQNHEVLRAQIDELQEEYDFLSSEFTGLYGQYEYYLSEYNKMKPIYDSYEPYISTLKDELARAEALNREHALTIGDLRTQLHAEQERANQLDVISEIFSGIFEGFGNFFHPIFSWGFGGVSLGDAFSVLIIAAIVIFVVKISLGG